MGFTYVNVTVRDMKASRDVKMLVDTGSTYIVLDPETIKELGLLETPYTVDLLLADGRKIRDRLFLAEVEVKGRRRPAFVAELNMPTPLLGVHALETLGFKANLMTGELEEISPRRRISAPNHQPSQTLGPSTRYLNSCAARGKAG
jgi:predicted aspartyl protease